jgi:hypothetical protein
MLYWPELEEPFCGLDGLPRRCCTWARPAQVSNAVSATSGPKPEKRTFMADMKFSCAHCGQHISCDELWSGHEIQCSACQNKLIVPPAQPPASVPGPALKPPVSQPPVSSSPKLSAGATQVARSTAPSAAPRRQPMPRPPKTGNPILKFAVITVVLAAVGGAGYLYLPGLVSQVQDMGTSKTAAPANAPAGGRGGPLGEVDGAMDVSDALDGGSPSRPPPAASRKPVAGQPPAPAATNSAANNAHGP